MKRSGLILISMVLVTLAACSKKTEKTDTASTAAQDTAASAPATVTYRAFGNEPFWSVTIDATGMHFVSPEDTVGMRFPPVDAMVMGDTLHWVARSERGAIDVRIWPGACSDGMSDNTHSFASGVRLNDMMYIGCAEKTSGDPTR
jgi:uncharacterized membrane protein